MRLARPAAIDAFWRLIATDDDVLLETASVFRLVVYIGQQDPAAVSTLVENMLSSRKERVRERAGQLAVLASLEWGGVPEHLTLLLQSEDSAARRGAAGTAARRLPPHTANTEVAAATLKTLFLDESEEVRNEAAQVADALRGEALRPFESVLFALIASPSFRQAASRLLMTLESAPDRVNTLALLAAERFVELSAVDAADTRTGARQIQEKSDN